MLCAEMIGVLQVVDGEPNPSDKPDSGLLGVLCIPTACLQYRARPLLPPLFPGCASL
jgi:hypothetical protein